MRPTMLIGTSGAAGAFTEAIVRDMARHTDRPIIFPLSSPPSLAEATPADLIAWTDGRALIATGSSFTPVTHKGITHVIGQANNAMLYPGLGLGTIVSRARLISVGMLAAAANALSSLVAVRLARRVAASAYRRLAQRDRDGCGRRGRGSGRGGTWPASNWGTSFNRWKTRCGSRSIAGSRHPDAG